ncbi:MAG: hypothetical protein KID09_03345 [Paenibacillus macerans]|nr:hypothetical protein [Paenibacillus macerans]
MKVVKVVKVVIAPETGGKRMSLRASRRRSKLKAMDYGGRKAARLSSFK